MPRGIRTRGSSWAATQTGRFEAAIVGARVSDRGMVPQFSPEAIRVVDLSQRGARIPTDIEHLFDTGDDTMAYDQRIRRNVRPAWTSPRRAFRSLPSLAADGAADYRSEPQQAADTGLASGDRLLGAVDAIAGRPVDELDEDQVRAELSTVDQAMRRLDARRCRLAATLVARQRQRARDARPNDVRAGERAERQTQRELADEFQWSPADTKRATKVGRQAADTPQVGDALDQGRLSPRHATLLADTLHWLEGEDLEHAQSTLLAAAQQQDPVTFGRTCRRLLADLDHSAATKAESRRHGRRRARIWHTDDGMVAFSGQLSGIAGEVLQTAVNAFRRPDAPDQHRTAEQATADAFTELATAALRTDEAPRRHGIPAQVIVTINQTDLTSQQGTAETRWSGPIPFGEAALLLDDCQAARLVLDAQGLPVEASEAVRTVPTAVYRGLVERDGGCIYEGCDIPADWCQVMHLETPFHLGGRLTFDTAALGCIHHHRLYDAGQLHLAWRDGRPALNHPGRPPRPPPADP
jgi:hypothetical protein